jgi:hypothetical protein
VIIAAAKAAVAVSFLRVTLCHILADFKNGITLLSIPIRRNASAITHDMPGASPHISSYLQVQVEEQITSKNNDRTEQHLLIRLPISEPFPFAIIRAEV